MKAINLEKLLPEDIPQGERVLWHGRPHWFSLFRRAYRADYVAAYFALMALWNTASALEAGSGEAALAAAKTLGSGAAALALLALLAWLSARTTLYVITTRRLVMKVGVALQVFYNLPFSQIASASARIFGDGSGDIPFALTNGQRIGYLHLWPHVRPFQFARPEPCLRSIPNAARVAELFSRALIAAANARHVGAVGQAPRAATQPLAQSGAPAARNAVAA